MINLQRLFLLLAVAASSASAAASSFSPAPAVTMYPSYNQALHVLVPNGTSTGGTVQYLATYPGAKGTAQCQAACVAYSKARCFSFVHILQATPTLVGAPPVPRASPPIPPGQCFAVLSPGFNPSYDTTAVSGIVEWPCRDDEDCSLNGKCGRKSGQCACRPAWKGHRCEQLNLLKPTRGAGYRGTDNGRNTSSWGGASLKGPDGKYHLWAAEMTEHCGIGTWQQNRCVCMGGRGRG